MEPNKWRKENGAHNRPGSAPAIAISSSRKKQHFQKSEQIYNSKYFNLSHYKQGGYNVELIEEENKKSQNSNKLLMKQRRPASSSGTRTRAQSAGRTNYTYLW